MQLADGDARASEPSERAFLSPGKAFALLFGVILVLGGAIFLLRPDDLPRESVTYPAGGDAPTFELTDAEAITRFEQLHDLFRQASMERDPSLISIVFTSDSPNVVAAQQDLKQLRDDRVLDSSRFETRGVVVESNTSDEIVLLQTVAVFPRFVDEKSGKNVTTGEATLDEVQWTLRFEDGVWKAYKILVVGSSPLN